VTVFEPEGEFGSLLQRKQNKVKEETQERKEVKVETARYFYFYF
jgi:hypothetical protein